MLTILIEELENELGLGNIHCRECNFENISILEYQCQRCGTFKDEKDSKEMCSCGGRVKNGELLICPNCNSENIDYQNIFCEWKEQLMEVCDNLEVAQSDSTELSSILIDDLINPYAVYREFKEWFKLYHTQKDDFKQFYKPYWLPIKNNAQNCFIDLSDANLPIIECVYDDAKVCNEWRINKYFDSMSNFILLLSRNDVEELKIYKQSKSIL